MFEVKYHVTETCQETQTLRQMYLVIIKSFCQPGTEITHQPMPVLGQVVRDHCSLRRVCEYTLM